MKKILLLICSTVLSLFLFSCDMFEHMNVVSEEYDDFDGHEMNDSALSFSLTVDGTYAVSYVAASGVRNIVIPSTYNDVLVTEVAAGGFLDSHVVSVYIPEGVVKIGNDAFSGCASLENVSIPSTVDYIGNNAFAGCTLKCSTYMKSYYLGNAMNPYLWLFEFGTLRDEYVIHQDTEHIYKTGLPVGDYGDCEPSVTISGTDSALKIIDGVIYSSAGDRLVRCIDTTLTSVDVENTVTHIDSYAFVGCDNLIAVNIPLDVSYIGDGAFYNCSSLSIIRIPDGINAINDYTFYGCESLRTVSFSVNVKHLGAFAFAECKLLKTVTIGYGGLRSIGYRAFSGCERLSQIAIPDSVSSIGAYAFYHCSGLGTIELPENLTEIKDYTFYYCTSLVHLDFGSKVESIGSYAFYNCNMLENVEFPSSLTSIGRLSFVACDSLTILEIPSNVTEIGEGAFNSCANISEVIIGEGVTVIGRSAFKSCTSLLSVTFRDPDSWYVDGEIRFDVTYNAENVRYLAAGYRFDKK